MSTNARPLIAGIGASAGGVEALEAFFGGLPPESGIAFVVVTHLDPTRESLLAEIIAHRTAMPVAAARDGDEVEANRIYVIPPGATLTIDHGRLRLHPEPAEHRERTPIDIFLASLAEDQQERAIGIILSGAGTDGTLGIKAIKENGGLTLAQTSGHGEPRFPDMPESAIATGLVDLKLAVEEMPERLVSYARHAGEIEGKRAAAALGAIQALLRTRLGHDFSGYKEKTFGRRVQRRMQVLQLPDIDAYVDRLRQDADELGQLFRDLLIGVTSFFRDPAAFQFVAENIIPQLFQDKGANAEVRVWVPGCATGEEVYSIAMLLREHMDKMQSPPKAQIFATDLDDQAIAIARIGRYPADLLRAVSPERRNRFFRREDHTYVASKEVRDCCVFSTHNVIRDPPFSNLDLISCRNLLIYLGAELQAELIPVFHYALRPDGFLFLGLSETIGRHGALFAAVDKKHHVFKRRGIVTPLPNALLHPVLQRRGTPSARRLPAKRGVLKADILDAAAATIMERFAPAYVVVSEEGEILHYSARTGKYLELPPGPPSKELLAMARKGLRLDLHTALRKAVETRRGVTQDNATVELDGGVQIVSITVEPIGKGGDTAFLVVFTDIGPLRPQAELVPRGPSAPGEEGVVQQLEQELQATKERLHASIEEQETSNEELRSSNEEMLSVNEELQSANEELETSKEETQSIVEELQTVNTELHRKVDELDRANADLRNLLESTQLATVFLDRQSVIQSFTSKATEIFRLIPGDRGRPLSDIVSRLDEESVERDICEVFEREQPVERRVSVDRGAAHYLMRLIPYRATDKGIEGVLLTFTNVTEIVLAEQREKALATELHHSVKSIADLLASLADQTGPLPSAVKEFLGTLPRRLDALAVTHELLSRSGRAEVSLEQVLRQQLRPHIDAQSGRVTVQGPKVLLRSHAALSLAMMFHELAINAARYGAFSAPSGRVEVSWKVTDGGAVQRLELHWIESGGPAVTLAKPSFGTEIIERTANRELGGEAKFAIDRGGLSCTFLLPVGPDIIVTAQSATQDPEKGVWSHGL
jgi:two-component system, chemotaxis family, CheB/CheR fusion protein